MRYAVVARSRANFFSAAVELSDKISILVGVRGVAARCTVNPERPPRTVDKERVRYCTELLEFFSQLTSVRHPTHSSKYSSATVTKVSAVRGLLVVAT